MTKPKRKPVKSAPIARHQLFPAVIALWFGALFGLGSLAVRPSLLEEFVIKSRVDLLIPAAAPPLGMTARMLLALILAAIGALIGTALARRIARPKQEVRERKRTALSTRDEGAGSRAYAGYADASTRNPAQDPNETGAAAAPGMAGNRRRSLAIEHEVDAFVPQDMAPLPGGGPQIFDIAASGLNDEERPPVPAFEHVSEAEPVPAAAAEAVPPPAPVALDWANAAPVLPPSADSAMPAQIRVPQAIEVQRQVFQPDPPAESAAAPAQSVTEPVAVAVAAVPEDGRQVFGMVPPTTPPADEPRQIFGAPVTDGHVPKEFVEAQGFPTSVFAAPEPNPLFAGRTETAPAVAEPAPAPAAPAISNACTPAPQAEAPVEAAAPVEATLPAAPAAFEPAPAFDPEPAPALPDPATLGIDDLSARLADSMRRRRAARSGAASPAAPDVTAPPPVADCAAPAPTTSVEHVVSEPVGAKPLAVEQPAEDGVPTFAVPPFTIPPFTVPAAEHETALSPSASPAQVQIPAAMRPLDLAGFEEDDAAAAGSLLPPRHIVPPAAPVEPAVPAPALAAAPLDEEPETAEEAAVAEENYASLLGVTPSPAGLSNPYVRIEEAESDETVAIEPVVIFPGQAVPPPRPFAAVAPADEATPFRRFDAPANAGPGQLIAATEAASALPPEETEQALRSALSNLQRMSGAA